MASAVLSAVSFTVPVTVSTGFSAAPALVSDDFGAAVVALGDGLAVSCAGPPRRPLSTSPTPSGSSGFSVAAGDGEALGAAAGALPDDGVAEGFGVAVLPWPASLPPAPVVAVSDGDGVFVAEADADGSGDSLGSSERVTQGPGAKGMSVASSASASLG